MQNAGIILILHYEIIICNIKIVLTYLFYFDFLLLNTLNLE